VAKGSRVTTLVVGGCTLSVLPTIKGLERERKGVRQAVLEIRPEVVALPVSVEGLRGLRAIWRGKEPEFFLSHYEEIYAIKLSKYGKVCVPPPSFTEAYAASTGEGIPVKAIDLNEKDFADAFVRSISTPSLVYHSLRWRWLKRKRFRAATARRFALDWDRAVNSLKGFRSLENRREEHMASRLAGLCRKYKSVLAILELERMEGVLSRLRTVGLNNPEGNGEEE